jgi:7-cyano-7-deazaguanine synthase
MTESGRAMVLFSGGQDSTACLAWALDRYDAVETVGFDYGQRHRVELDCRPRIVEAVRDTFPEWRDRLGEDHVLDLSVLGAISDTALTRDAEIVLTDSGLPNTFVPGRNLLFLTLAAALAYRRGVRHIVGGMCETDFSGYPDCRDATIRAMRAALNAGMDTGFEILTPLMWLDKAAVWTLTEALGGRALVDIVREETHSCYLGARDVRHAWGYGCAACPACHLRARGYLDYLKAKAL